MSKDLIQALEEALSVCQSVNTGRHHRVVRDGSVHYLQTEEWCKWAEEEVAPALRQALSRHRSSVESVELPDGDLHVAHGRVIPKTNDPSLMPPWSTPFYAASTVRSLIAAAVERERELCAKVCDAEDVADSDFAPGVQECIAAAIRARGSTPAG